MAEKDDVFLAAVTEALAPVLGRLAAHGGGIEVAAADAETGKVSLRFRGACIGCPLASETLNGIVEDILSDVEGIGEVIVVE